MPYTTPEAVRATYPSLTDSLYTDQLLTDLIEEFEGIAEEYLDTAYLPRTVTETIVVPPGVCWSGVTLRHVPVRSVATFTADGTAQTGYTLDKTLGTLAGVSGSNATIVVTYDHGVDAPTTMLVRACKMYVRNCAKADTSGTSRDVLSQAVDGATTRYATPNWDERRPTGYLDVDRLLNSVHDARVLVA